jgi:hypothetical protein
MSPFRYRDDDSNTGTIVGVVVGALAGFAAGMFVAQRVGGFGGLTSRIRERASERFGLGRPAEETEEELDEYEDDELESEETDDSLEARVLEAFRNDPILSERAVDIGSIGDGIIELAGWVETEEEAEHAVTIARGVPDIDTVVNRISIGDEEQRYRDAARRVQQGDPSLTEARWEGRTVGTGRRRQGTSQDTDRHADPKVPLEDHWMSKDVELRNAAEETEGIAERRRSATKRTPRGDRTGGSPVAPTGVPKADHVAQPREADVSSSARVDAARDAGGERTSFGDTGRS